MKKFVIIFAVISLLVLVSGCLTINKEADKTEASPGDTITYTITVTYENDDGETDTRSLDVYASVDGLDFNDDKDEDKKNDDEKDNDKDKNGEDNGQLDYLSLIHDVKVVDSLVDLGEDGDIGTMKPGDKKVIEYEYVIPDNFLGELENTATVTWKNSFEDEWEESATFSVMVAEEKESEIPAAPKEETSATYVIVASSGNGGSISGEGSTTINEGDSKTYTMTPAPDPAPGEYYTISDVLVNGISVGAVSSYTFENIQGDHTIYVDFGRNVPVKKPPSDLKEAEQPPHTVKEIPVDLAEIKELPYTGFSWIYPFVGLAMLLAASGFLLAFKKLRKYSI